VITDANGVPLAASLTGANAHDVTQMLPLIESIPLVRGKVGHPKHRPARLVGDRAYDSFWHEVWLRYRGIEPLIAERGVEHGSGLGILRWVVERTLAWLHQFRRLRIRYERRDDIHEGFLSLGCALICWNVLRHGFC
jgi:transposase